MTAYLPPKYFFLHLGIFNVIIIVVAIKEEEVFSFKILLPFSDGHKHDLGANAGKYC